MNYYNLEQLKSNLKKATSFHELIPNGGRTAVISEYGGRLLGLFPSDSAVNILWSNSNIESTINSRNRDLGGDRYWISPERTFFYKNPPQWEGWFCQEGLDPANFHFVEKSDSNCTLTTNLSIVNLMTKDTYTGTLTRKFSIAREPISTGSDYIGIETTEYCVLNAPHLQVNGWNLTCIISGGVANPGTVLIPVKPNSKALSYFRTIPLERLKIKDDYIAFKIDVSDIYKLAIRPEDIDFSNRTKIGYVLKSPVSKDYLFIVKVSDDIPKTQKECFDIARDHPDSEIGVIQSYNSETSKGASLQYGEIELQLNIFNTIRNTSVGKAVHSMFAYIGNKEEILNIIEKYMKIQEFELF